MAQPTPYERGFNFTDHSTSSPDSQQPGVQLDAEFDAIKETLDEVLTNLTLLQRDDGAVKNGAVGVLALQSNLISALATAGMNVAIWAPSLSRSLGAVLIDGTAIYIATTAHDSAADIDTDIAAEKIVRIFDASGLLAETSSALIGTMLDDPDAVPRTQAEKNADIINVLDFHDPDLGYDLSIALTYLLYRAYPTRTSITIHIPRGRNWTCYVPLIPARQFHLIGESMEGTCLSFYIDEDDVNAVMKGAICIGLATTLAEYDDDYPDKAHGSVLGGGGSDFSTISDMTINIASAPTGFDYGIWSAGRIFTTNVILVGCGMKWIAGNLQSTAGSVTGNTCTSQALNTHSLLAREYAFYVEGDNSNASKMLGCDAYVPVAGGFLDASFLGNTYDGCHASAASGIFRFKAIAPGESNRSIFSGCYAEEGGSADAIWDVASPSMIVAPMGALPTKQAGKNIALMTLPGLSCFWTPSSIRIAADLAQAFTLGGSSAQRALELAGEYIRIRAANNVLYDFTGGGAGLTFGADGVTKYNFATNTFEIAPNLNNLATYADNAAAVTGGLPVGRVYKTSAGALMIRV